MADWRFGLGAASPAVSASVLAAARAAAGRGVLAAAREERPRTALTGTASGAASVAVTASVAASATVTAAAAPRLGALTEASGGGAGIGGRPGRPMACASAETKVVYNERELARLGKYIA